MLSKNEDISYKNTSDNNYNIIKQRTENMITYDIQYLFNQFSTYLKNGDYQKAMNSITEINNIINNDDNLQISNYIQTDLLEPQLIFLKNCLENHNIFKNYDLIFQIISFDANLSLDSVLFNHFFLLSDFLLTISKILQEQSDIFELSDAILTIIGNILINDIKILEIPSIDIIVSILASLDYFDLIIQEKKSWIFSHILKHNISDGGELLNVVLEEGSKMLYSKFDSIKYYGVKSFMNYLEWGSQITYYLAKYKIIEYLCQNILQFQSIRLVKLSLNFFLSLIQHDSNYLPDLIHHNLIDILNIIIKNNEEKCSVLCLYLYKFIIFSSPNDFNMNFSFLNSFIDKNFAAKKAALEFLIWIYQNFIELSQKIDMSTTLNIVSELVQTGDHSIYDLITTIYILLENNEASELILNILYQDENYQNYLFSHDDSQNNNNILHMIEKFHTQNQYS